MLGVSGLPIALCRKDHRSSKDGTGTSGGETKFFDRAFGGLQVEPKLGSALIFPTATLRGEADERYLHSGEPVKRGTKWIVGTWLMEAERTDAEACSQGGGALPEGLSP